MTLIIDRFEGEFAVVELDDRSTEQIPKKLIPAEAREGDCLSITVDQEQTAKRRQEINKLTESIFE